MFYSLVQAAYCGDKEKNFFSIWKRGNRVNKHSVAKVLVRAIFIISLFIAILSVTQIVTANLQINTSLKEWEKIKDDGSEADDLNVERLLEKSLFSQTVDQGMQDKEIDGKNNTMFAKDNTFSLYNNYPTKGELVGKIIIPAIKKELPIIHGTENEQLAQGVGHYIGSVLPGENDNSVLAGHRDTVFRGLGQVQIGDQIQIETVAGLFTYQIEKQQIIDSDDRTIIVPHDEPIVTLITCYPFDFVGAAPQRYILTGKLIE